MTFLPLISEIQKIALYETKNDFYLVGSNNTQTNFRVLKLSRTVGQELSVIDDGIIYSEAEVRWLVSGSEGGHRSRSSSSNATKVLSAFGIVGFVRFLEGYYLILITKRRYAAVIRHHIIYKVEDTAMVYIPNEAVSRANNPDELRYLKMFQSIDLSSNFYFSYSYDITHTLQINMAVPRNIPRASTSLKSNSKRSDSREQQDFIDQHLKENLNLSKEEEVVYGVRNEPNRRFVWNSYLLSQTESKLNPNWVLYIMHGFISQSNICIYGRSIYVTVIARRSNKYAGTRFLKRGANFEGDVANEVETEQIVHDVGGTSQNKVRITSFVQMRGSIPAHWSQDISKMVPKPTIYFDLGDPYFETAGAHFNDLLKRYGSPTIILNLVKTKEKKKHESQLSEVINGAVKYLNLMLPPEHRIQYVTFDMARMNKGKEANVMGRLADIAHELIRKTGIYCSDLPYANQKMSTVLGFESFALNGKCLLQTGIIRVNCVDCLDRTNTAQFALGKCALGYQLCALGVLSKPVLDFDSDCVRLLEALYEDHGDTLALQYGGSQLVHRIKTYRKTAPWTSQGNDIMQTLSRYYSNTFSDAEKQHAMNLFLGLFVPQPGTPPIWENATDYYLHHPEAVGNFKRKKSPLTQWWDAEVLESLPLALNQTQKQCVDIVPGVKKDLETIDGYKQFYRSSEFTELNETFAFMISHSVRDFMPHCVTDYSPFRVRIRPGRMREETASKANTNMKNPSLTGHCSTGSTASSSSGSEESDNEDVITRNSDSQCSMSKENLTTFESLFPTMKQVYGIDCTEPNKADKLMYKRFVSVGRIATKKRSSELDRLSQLLTLSQQNQTSFNSDDIYHVTPPEVSAESIHIYENYVNRSIYGAADPDQRTLNKYEEYAKCQLGLFSVASYVQ
ncbi:unnamed protein product [Bemisia tabaci]|uniref:SAC domain-containing protein n=1 Tax=Bemisia tabaci TaxID=7038 RepID=A0A9P0A4B9_BEMTA|nr:unnamed protein product [Bemisia tabaci]